MRVLLVQPRSWSADGHANFDQVEAMLEAEPPAPGDLVLLPELVGSSLPGAAYLDRLRGLAAASRAAVVGGSHYDVTASGTVNRGAVVDPAGEVVARYDKRHPYGVEARDGVLPGTGGAAFEQDGRRLLVLLCADLWYSASLSQHADAVLVPAFSVTQWPTPAPARALWQHLSVARAYEFMTYVAVSDWHHEVTYHGQPCAGVTGFADPCPPDPEGYFTGRAGHAVSACELDFERLDGFRLNRSERGFARPSPA
ncbi:carbon-nitrogen hydrolase family protein [Nonomuraea cavernae]|uniref:carbon-nitrogen hydrolase family protein n=1 Tax=Nonomuraea cavernae TaxID=2045107 RepID=UPI0033BFCFE2